ncbi:MAG: glycerol-3-phosphate 1-O-acyltransferase PlsY [Burkholderiales bacterium]|nr:glycerol-3-phosphate 1-O-acyltransferase PlsY [Burkholderiales bacterium]
MDTIIITLLAYLIGSISFAVIVSRAFGLADPRSYGSGNPGATNVLRTGRKTAAALTLLGDSAKGWVAVYLARGFGDQTPPEIMMAVAAVGVVIGHMYPVFFRFQGGKGVSTVLGALIALNIYLAAGAAATWIIIAFFFRISSLAALVSALFAPFFCFLLYGLHPFTAAVSTVSVLLVWRHKTNIGNLLAGREGRIGSRDGGSSRN